ncbi:hypothetical protein CANTEDRAFT_119320 [Yamadazyma tenuis ATCC 10573]|nr:uncharacterized protein CANTEDRAFT_119320 [Yamadazyma tenuis ATCC 10573]EGV65224.1 hypothetical protein CANTEDRAFT_119320 [Yamadazyma tenuis ATCC 10573]
MSCLEFQNPLVSIDDEVVFGKYCSSYFLEDFSLLRLYGGQVKGHPFLIMAILIKVIDEFLISNYRIRFEDSENIENLQINMTSTYLRVRNHLFSFDRKTLTLFTSFDVYTISEVVMNLRNRSYFEISKFIEPLEFKYVVECFLHLDTFMEAKSLDTIMRPDYYFTNPIVNLNSFVHHEFNTISAQAYSFLKLLCRYIQDIDSENDFLDSMFCRELERSMNYLNNHIYFNAIFHTLQNNPSKQNKVKAHFLDHPSEDWLFSENFALFEDNSKISIKKILKNYFFVKVRDPTKPLQSGTIIKHEKFETYGIVLGEVMTTNENTHYYRVYTTKKTTECYNLNSISVVDHNTKDLDKLLNFILKSCGEDVIASLFGNCLVLSESHPLLLMF